MEQTFFYKNLAKGEEQLFDDYISKKIPKLKGLLQKFSDDSHNLRVSVEKFEKHNAFSVEICLNLPTRSLASKEASHTLNKAIDFSLDRLIAQLKKHLSQLRKEREHRSIRNQDTVLPKITEFAEFEEVHS